MAADRDPLTQISPAHRAELEALARSRATPLDASFVAEAYRALAKAIYDLCLRRRF